MSDSSIVTVMKLAKDSNLDQQLIIQELLEMGGFEKANKYTKLTREIADQVVERIRRKQRMEVEQTTTLDGTLIRRRRVVVSKETVGSSDVKTELPKAEKKSRSRVNEPEKTDASEFKMPATDTLVGSDVAVLSFDSARYDKEKNKEPVKQLSEETTTFTPVETLPFSTPSSTPIHHTPEVQSETPSETPSKVTTEITDEVVSAVKQDVKQEVQSETPSETPSKVTTEITDEVISAVKQDVKQEVQSETPSETPSKVTDEVVSAVKQDVKQEVQSETPSETPFKVTDEVVSAVKQDVKQKVQSETTPKTLSKVTSKVVPVVKQDVKQKVQSETTPKTLSKVTDEVVSAVKQDVKQEVQSETPSKTAPIGKQVGKPESKLEAKPESKAHMASETKTESRAAKRFLPFAARPEASASPMENSDTTPTSFTASPSPSTTTPSMVPKEERKLGPTGRFIVLPAPTSKIQTRVDGAPPKPTEGAFPIKPTSVSYKEKREEEELLRKTGFTARKKQEVARPTLPPEGRRKIKVDEFISVSELAHQMGLKATELMKKLLSLGQMVTINSTLDFDTATIVASEWGYEIENVAFQEEKFFTESATSEEKREKRPPIVTIMGHVDHGKTSLLDAIRKSDIASKESGGITQHIGAYKVKTRDGDIVFIDTPGHEAFSAMRARGASVTDLVVLVVAADDGVMPQTEEAINHCRAAHVPMLVAITKVDKHNANPQMVREKLTAYGLVDEKWGGDTIIVEVSAITKAGLDTLLEMILLQAEMLELTANSESPARAVVLEAELDRAKGPVVNLLVLDGTLSVGDHVVCGLSGGKIRTLTDDRGRQVKSVGPATPVEVTGFDSVPVPGDECRMVPDEKAAKRILDRRRDEAKAKELARKSQAKGMEAIRQAIARGEQKHLNVILKTDVQGTMEALRDALTRLSNDIVRVNVVHCGVGGINESDINLAITAEGIIMGFRVRPDAKARHRADQEGVAIHQYNVIYDMLDDVRDIMRGMLPKEKKEQQVGRVEVRQVFNIPKVGTVAGCYVVEGKVTRTCHVRVFHDNIQVFEGRLASLRRFKDDVREVVAGYECGISIDGFNDIREGDIIEAYEIIETPVEV